MTSVPSSSGDAGGGLSALLSRALPPSFLPPGGLSPVHNNVLAALVTVVYVKAVMEIGTVVRVRYGVPELSRKFVHLCATSIVVFWPLFDPRHWGWRLNVTVPAAMSLRLLYKGAILKDPEDEDVRSMSRTSSPSELLYGPLQMTLIMCYVGLTQFMSEAGVIVMASLAGDGIAALVGRQYGRYGYKFPLGGSKTVEGTVGCVAGTIGWIGFYSYMCGMEVAGWRTLLAYGCISATAEATALHNWDNLLLAATMQLSARHVPKYIGR